MNESKRRGIVWGVIERLAFRPTIADKDGWLWLYVRTLPRLWGLHEADIQTRRNTGFDVDFLNLACDYTVEAPDKYSVTISNAATTAPACWHLQVVPCYCSKAALCSTTGLYPRQAVDRYLLGDVQCVLDGMIFHPRNHAHGNELGIASELADDSALSPYEIRLGGGIENGFVFLTHLRYQFCLLSKDARQVERTRLIQLFTTAIRDRRTTVAAAELFDLRV